jgi:hypothetical protein
VCIEDSRSLGFERKLVGKFHLKLNIGLRPIENKYHEGKVKRTLKRKLKVLEIAEEEAGVFRTQFSRLLRISLIPCCLDLIAAISYICECAMLLVFCAFIDSQP